MVEERDREYEREQGQVVDAEVGEVLAHTRGGFRERVRSGESGAVDELGPGAAVGERAASIAEEAREEVSDSEVRCWGVGGGLLRFAGCLGV